MNEGDIDRVVRVGIGMLFIAAGFLFTIPPYTWIAFVLGGWTLGTGIVGYSPIYGLFDWTTAKRPRPRRTYSRPAPRTVRKPVKRRTAKKPVKKAVRKTPARRSTAKRKPVKRRG